MPLYKASPRNTGKSEAGVVFDVGSPRYAPHSLQAEEPALPVATSTPQPSVTRIKSRPVHKPTEIQLVESDDDHSLPQ